MLDYTGAQLAVVALLENPDPTNKDLRSVNLPSASFKSIWTNQIIGLYDLIFPYMHIDFALRQETDLAIKTSFKLHHMSSKHGGKRSKRMIWKNDGVVTSYMPRELTVPIAGLVRLGSPVNVIGYGLGQIPYSGAI